jgi:hypothetical protein
VPNSARNLACEDWDFLNADKADWADGKGFSDEITLQSFSKKSVFICSIRSIRVQKIKPFTQHSKLNTTFIYHYDICNLSPRPSRNFSL